MKPVGILNFPLSLPCIPCGHFHDVHHRRNPIQQTQALVIFMSTADADQHHHNTTRSLPDNPGYLICLLVHFCLRAGGDWGLVVVFKVKVEISTFDE